MLISEIKQLLPTDKVKDDDFTVLVRRHGKYVLFSISSEGWADRGHWLVKHQLDKAFQELEQPA